MALLKLLFSPLLISPFNLSMIYIYDIIYIGVYIYICIDIYEYM